MFSKESPAWSQESQEKSCEAGPCSWRVGVCSFCSTSAGEGWSGLTPGYSKELQN